jgi:ubiquitin-protein ligase
MEQNKIDNNIDSNNFRKSLGIIKLYKDGERDWEVRMFGPKKSPYEEGVFDITINFPENFPNKRPEVSIKNKIFHNQVHPSNGHIDAAFLLTWEKNTSVAELLVGIYLCFIFEQNPDKPCSSGTSNIYRSSLAEFNKKAREWAIKYASPTISDLISINKINSDNLENKINLLAKQVEKLENDVNLNKSITMQLLQKLKLSHQNKILLGEELISIIFQTPKNDVHCSIVCKDTDTFVEVECSLYKKYPQYLESEQYFIVNGKKIDKYKTLKENGIKDSDIILLYQMNQTFK